MPSKESLERATIWLNEHDAIFRAVSDRKIHALADLLDEAIREAVLKEHFRTCTVKTGSCFRCIELGDERSISVARENIAQLREGKP